MICCVPEPEASWYPCTTLSRANQPATCHLSVPVQLGVSWCAVLLQQLNGVGGSGGELSPYSLQDTTVYTSWKGCTPQSEATTTEGSVPLTFQGSPELKSTRCQQEGFLTFSSSGIFNYPEGSDSGKSGKHRGHILTRGMSHFCPHRWPCKTDSTIT